jgi:hypothetical protein
LNNDNPDELFCGEFVAVRLSSLFIVRSEVAWDFAMLREFIATIKLISGALQHVSPENGLHG